MRLSKLLSQELISLLADLRRPEDDEIRQVRPFYLFLLSAIALMYFWTVTAESALHSPGPLALFTALLILHSWLHWISPHLSRHRLWILPYFLVQGSLIFLITWAGRNQGILLGLYMAMIGEMIGLLERTRLSAAAVAAYLALFGVNIGMLWGWTTVPTMLAAAAPMAVFVVIYVFMFMRQANARERAQKLLRELEAAHRQLAEYAEQVEALTLATERQRMARELHDTLAQGLAGLILQLEALEAQLARGNAEKAGLIAGQAKERARATLAEARRTIDDLRSRPDLSDSLLDVLRQEVERFSTATGIPCALDLPPTLSLPAPIAEHVSRCVAEGLANAARHARASRAAVSVAVDQGELLVEIRDDGTGFDPVAVAGQAGHYGLLGLRERARLAGGVLEVESAPGAGTRLRLRLPLS